FQAEDGIRDKLVTGVQTCALPILAVAIAPWPAAPVGWAFLAVLVARGGMLFAPLWTEPGGPATGHAIGGGILLIPLFDATFVARSEERRVGKECRARSWSERR